MLIPTDLLYSDKPALEQKLLAFKQAGHDNIHFVFDFDRTLTVRNPNTDADITSWIILREHTPAEAQEIFWGLYDKYRPKEIAGTMTVDDAVDWWSTVLRTFVEYKLDLSEVEEDFLNKATVRPGVIELFKTCKNLGIPMIILSAGVRDVIEMWCKVYDIQPDLIISTDLHLDRDSIVIGWDESTLVHTLNKHEADHPELTAIRTKRPYAVVVGDGMGDADMADGDETILRVRLLDPRPDEILDIDAERLRTFERFDAMIESGDVSSLSTVLTEFTN